MVNAWTVALTKYPKYGKISTTYIKAIVDEKREKGQRFSFKFPVIQPFTYRCLLLLHLLSSMQKFANKKQ